MDNIITPARLQLIKRAIQSQEKYLEELEAKSVNNGVQSWSKKPRQKANLLR